MGAFANYLAHFKSVEELEAMMQAILNEGTSGKSVVQWSVGDSSANKERWMDLPPRARSMDVGMALSIKDPDTYPPDTFIPVTQTRPTFT